MMICYMRQLSTQITTFDSLVMEIWWSKWSIVNNSVQLEYNKWMCMPVYVILHKTSYFGVIPLMSMSLQFQMFLSICLYFIISLQRSNFEQVKRRKAVNNFPHGKLFEMLWSFTSVVFKFKNNERQENTINGKLTLWPFKIHCWQISGFRPHQYYLMAGEVQKLVIIKWLPF